MNKKVLSLLMVVGMFVAAVLTTASAPTTVLANPPGGGGNGQDTCPSGGDWVKVDGLSGLSYTYTAPAGKVVVQTCYKAGTTLRYQTYDPGITPVTVSSNVFNHSWCTSVGGGCNYKELSHASFRLADEPYQACSIMTEVDGAWSDWVLVEDHFEQYQMIQYVDSQDPTVVCATDKNVNTDSVCEFDPTIRTGDPECYDHYQTCDVTVGTGTYTEWSDWEATDDPLVQKRFHQEILVDSRDLTTQCGFGPQEWETNTSDFCTVFPDDPSCQQCPYPGLENLKANDAGCVAPTPEPKKAWTPPTKTCPACPDPVLGFEDWKTGYVDKDIAILFITGNTQCYIAQGYDPGNENQSPFYYQYQVLPNLIAEGLANQPLTFVWDEGVGLYMHPMVQAGDGVWYVRDVPVDQEVIILVGTHEGPFNYGMLTSGEVELFGGSYLPFYSVSGVLPY